MLSAEVPEPEIIHQDRDLLIVHKPPGMPTTAPSPSQWCLVAWVSERIGSHQAHATSRLDSQVSGLVTFALTRAARRHLIDARRHGRYERVYLGITTHEAPADVGEWTSPISIDPRDPKRRVAGPGRGRRDALTRYELLARAPRGSLLRFVPSTGRTHQLRVHAAEASVPLFGDTAYGAERREVLPSGSVVTARRVMLHCAKVSFPSLSGGERLCFEAPVRPDMERVWLALGGLRAQLQA